MTDPNTYDVKELDATIDAVRAKFRKKLEDNPQFFGNDQAVSVRATQALGENAPKETLEARINGDDQGVALRTILTLDETAPKGTLAVRSNIDAGTTAGIMRTVDLTILDHNAKTEDVEKVARRAAKEHCATVCVYPEHVAIVARVMQEEGVTDVPPIAVVGFPSVPAPTAEITAQTVQQTRDAIAAGAKEIDMVLPTSFREDKGDYPDHFNYIKAVVDAAHEQDIPVKVILETAYLTDRQITKACVISKIAGADWVKTSTGFAEADKFAAGKGPEEKGAAPHVVALMRRTVGDETLDKNSFMKPIGVKASGGVRNRDQAIAVLLAGADRIGASGGIDARTAAEKVAPDQDVGEPKKAAGGRGAY